MANLAFVNNQSWALTWSLYDWAPIYPLVDCIFHMEMRATPETDLVAYAWTSDEANDNWNQGLITYDPISKLLFITAPWEHMADIKPGEYTYDLQMNWHGFKKDLTIGTITFTRGTTR